MKYYPIQFMDSSFRLLSDNEARQILKRKGFKTIKLGKKTHSILVKVKDLIDIKNNINLYLLDDNGTEINKYDIEKVLKEKITCE